MAAAQVATVLLLTLLGAYALPRGVDPSQAAHYEGVGGTFTCLDGSKTIPLSQVNDNYCDCPSDGSDEPGSSACYWGKFYCANRGHQAQFLSASFVDDGICDCCDGTDELVGCRNTCLDKGATERQVVRHKAEQMKRSLETKQRLISDGVTRRAGWSTRASSIDTEIAQLEKEVARIEDEKTAAQAAADEDRKRLQQEEEERQRQATDAQAKAAEDAVQAASATGDATGAEETDEERGRRIASQWTNDPDAAGVPSEGESEVTEGDVDDAGHLGQEEYEEGDEEDDNIGDEGKQKNIITFRQFLEMQWNESKSAWAKEVADVKLLIHVFKKAFAQLYDTLQVVWAGGIRAQQIRSAHLEEQRRQQRQQQVERELEQQLSALYAPWRDPEWQEAAMMMQQERASAAARGEEWVPTAEQQALIDKATQKAEQMEAEVVAKQKAAEEATQKAEEAKAAAMGKQKKKNSKKNSKKQKKQKKQEVSTKPQKAISKPAAVTPPVAGHHDYTPTPPGDYAHSPSHHQQHIYSPLDSKVYQLNTDLSAAKEKLQEVKDEKKVIQRYHSSGIKFDYGPGDTFLPLAGRCISDVGARWTYEACFFDAAIQKEPHNPNNKVSLGTWRGWDNDYTEAVFDNGDPCAGAPNRSLRVKLLCGDEEHMYGGEEPATCLYTVSLTTPLACNQSDLDKEHAKLAELERFEAEIRAEIETAEKAKATAAGDRTEL